jgi:hypothetical protein
MVNELGVATVSFSDSFRNRLHLPFVEVQVIPDGLGHQRSIPSVSQPGELVESVQSLGVKPQSDRFWCRDLLLSPHTLTLTGKRRARYSTKDYATRCRPATLLVSHMETPSQASKAGPAATSSGGLPQLVDTHCHLADDRLHADATALIARAEAAGVRVIVSVGAIGSIQTDRDTVAIAHRHDNVYAVIGVHPHNADSCDDRRMDEIRELARSQKVVAIGETGMDLHYQNSTRQAQEESLRRHLRLAQELSLPLVIHCREAE